MDTIVHVQGGKYLGQTKFAPSLLRESLALAVKEVSGVAYLGKYAGYNPSRAIIIHRSKDSNNWVIDVKIVVLSGYAVPDVAYRVQEAVINAAAQFTDHKIDRVNILVKGANYGTSIKQK